MWDKEKKNQKIMLSYYQSGDEAIPWKRIVLWESQRKRAVATE